jgi:quercetin dioxygenase-like cupin family protein
MSKYFLHGDRLFAKQLAPGASAKIGWGEKTMLSLVTLEPGSQVGLHAHPHEQAGYVIEGEFEFTIGDEQRMVKPGDMYIIPGNVQHGVLHVKTRSVALDIFAPPRDEYKK